MKCEWNCEHFHSRQCSFRCRNTNIQGNDYTGNTSSCLVQTRISITWAFTVLRNDRKCTYVIFVSLNKINYCGLVLPYDDTDLTQYWIHADLLSVRFYGNHLRPVSQEVLKISNCKITSTALGSQWVKYVALTSVKRGAENTQLNHM